MLDVRNVWVCIVILWMFFGVRENEWMSLMNRVSFHPKGTFPCRISCAWNASPGSWRKQSLCTWEWWRLWTSVQAAGGNTCPLVRSTLHLGIMLILYWWDLAELWYHLYRDIWDGLLESSQERWVLTSRWLSVVVGAFLTSVLFKIPPVCVLNTTVMKMGLLHNKLWIMCVCCKGV